MTPDIVTALYALEREARTHSMVAGQAGLDLADEDRLREADAWSRHADQLAALRARYAAERTDEIATLRAQVKNLERLLSVD